MSKDNLAHKRFKAVQRRRRTRAPIHGSSERPRLSVRISSQHISAQIINDQSGQTLAYATSVGSKKEGTMADKAALVGGDIAKKAQKAKVKKVVFDRGEHKYHGRVKSLADGARKGGLEF